jgi:hypothetical protein
MQVWEKTDPCSASTVQSQIAFPPERQGSPWADPCCFGKLRSQSRRTPSDCSCLFRGKRGGWGAIDNIDMPFKVF